MSLIYKVARAKALVKRNDEILIVVKKLLKEYEYNHTTAKNLFTKSCIDKQYIPTGYEKGSYPHYNFATDW